MSCHLWLARRLTVGKIVTRSINESCPPRESAPKPLNRDVRSGTQLKGLPADGDEVKGDMVLHQDTNSVTYLVVTDAELFFVVDDAYRKPGDKIEVLHVDLRAGDPYENI